MAFKVSSGVPGSLCCHARDAHNVDTQQAQTPLRQHSATATAPAPDHQLYTALIRLYKCTTTQTYNTHAQACSPRWQSTVSRKTQLRTLHSFVYTSESAIALVGTPGHLGRTTANSSLASFTFPGTSFTGKAPVYSGRTMTQSSPWTTAALTLPDYCRTHAVWKAVNSGVHHRHRISNDEHSGICRGFQRADSRPQGRDGAQPVELLLSAAQTALSCHDGWNTNAPG